MDITRLKEKLGMVDGDGFASLSSGEAGLPYVCNVYGGDDSHFTFESDSMSVVYYTDNENEMLVQIRDSIRESKMLSEASEAGDMVYRWSTGAVSISATHFPNKNTYKVVRDNKMVSSHTELSHMQRTSHVIRKVGLHPHVDIRTASIAEALYVFLANFESIRIPPNDHIAAIRWVYDKVCGFEGVKIKLPKKISSTRSGMLARPVKCIWEGVERKGVLLNLHLGERADVLITDIGIQSIDKREIWI